MNYFIIVFKNTHDAMAGEKKLNELNYSFRIMPTPTVITQSCGICVRVEDENIINSIIKEDSIIYKGIYKIENREYILVK